MKEETEIANKIMSEMLDNYLEMLTKLKKNIKEKTREEKCYLLTTFTINLCSSMILTFSKEYFRHPERNSLSIVDDIKNNLVESITNPEIIETRERRNSNDR